MSDLLVVNEEELTFDEDDGTARYDGQRFTGRSVEVAEDGTRLEQEYDRGYKHGCYRVHAPDGMLLVESHYKFGAAHGLHRRWHRNGQLAEERMAEEAFIVWERHWDPEGNVTLDYRMTEDDFRSLKLSDEMRAAARART